MDKTIIFAKDKSISDAQDFPLSENQPNTAEQIDTEYHTFAIFYSTCF